MSKPLFRSLASSIIAHEIHGAQKSVCYAAPGIQQEPADAIAALARQIGIEWTNALSAEPIKDELNEIRKDFMPSLGKDHEPVLLKAQKPLFEKCSFGIQIKGRKWIRTQNK